MTISFSKLHGALRAYGGQRVTPGDNKQQTKTQSKADEQDRVTLSSEAQRLNQALSIVTKADEIRQEKVNALKETVKTGRYRTDATKVAESLMSEVRRFNWEV